MTDWETVIGLEVHVQLATKSKLFCGCSSAFGEPPNTNVCPVCLGLPGSLPVTNAEALRLATRGALALECTVHTQSIFARKSYFYPDLPKGYQISQFDRPLATSGVLRIDAPDRDRVDIGITRLHLEEDAGKSLHDKIPGKTGIDYNRCGVPLAEIVSEPDLRSPAEARAYLVALKQILEYADVSDCNMEEGHLRVDANLSVRPFGQTALGTKQEVKNMNSFAAVEHALESLRDQQVQTLESGGMISQETFSAATSQLRLMRSKEASDDYRYFPDPDLPPLVLQPDTIQRERAAMPELPAAKKQRFQAEYDVTEYDAGVLSSTRTLSDYFEAVVRGGAAAKAAAHWITGPVLAHANDHGGALNVPAQHVADLLSMTERGALSGQAAKRVYKEIAESGEEPDKAASRLSLMQISDHATLEHWVDSLIDIHGEAIQRFRDGETKLLGFFVGQIMQQSKGRADPKKVQEIFLEKIGR